MNLIPWSRKRRQEGSGREPDSALARLREDMDTLFDRFLRDPWSLARWDGPWGEPASFPRMDLAESDQDVTVTMELPGVDPQDIHIDVSGNTLTVRGEKKRVQQERQRDYHYVERQYGSFHRTVTLPAGVDPDKVDAKYKDGVLTVTVAKTPGARPHRIPVRTA